MDLHPALQFLGDLVAPLADVRRVAVACRIHHRQVEVRRPLRPESLLLEMLGSASDIIFLKFLNLVLTDELSFFQFLLLQLGSLFQIELLEEGVDEGGLASACWATHHDVEVLRRVVLAHQVQI